MEGKVQRHPRGGPPGPKPLWGLLIVAGRAQNGCATVDNSVKTGENLWITRLIGVLCQRIWDRGCMG